LIDDMTFPTLEDALMQLVDDALMRNLLVLGSFITVAAAQRWITMRGGVEIR